MPWSNLTHHDAAIGTTLSTLPYYLYTPSRALDSVHLVTWLHGGIFSSGPAKQRLDLMAHTFAALDNCYVLHPIAPAGVNWLGYYRNHPGVVRRFDEPVTPLMKQLMQLIEHVRGTALPSARRGLLIVGGASMGGYATWDLISRHPRLVDVALPMCGGGDPSQAGRFGREMKIWAFHARTDPIVNVAASRNMFAGAVASLPAPKRRVSLSIGAQGLQTVLAREADGGRLRFTEYQFTRFSGASIHSVACWLLPSNTSGLMDWIFAPSRRGSGADPNPSPLSAAAQSIAGSAAAQPIAGSAAAQSIAGSAAAQPIAGSATAQPIGIAIFPSVIESPGSSVIPSVVSAAIADAACGKYSTPAATSQLCVRASAAQMAKLHIRDPHCGCKANSTDSCSAMCSEQAPLEWDDSYLRSEVRSAH
jgi:pimeloyl-ACP methyl ester carboxylesterase